MSEIIVDSREPERYYDFLVKAFPGLRFSRQALKEGDYASEKVLVERKTLMDLQSSIVGNKGGINRLFDQAERLSLHEDKVVCYLITGKMADYYEKMKEIGVVPKEDILYGAIASLACRYGYHIIWAEEDFSGLVTLIKFIQKVDEGKWQVPVRRNEDILSAKLLGLTSFQWYDVRKKFGGLVGISKATDRELLSIYGIGPAKVERIRKILR